jgi:hypothetical protein
VLEYSSTTLLRAMLWLVAGVFAINGFIQTALDHRGRTAGTDDVPGWVLFVIAVIIAGFAAAISQAGAKMRFDLDTGTLSIVRFGRVRVVSDVTTVIVGDVPPTFEVFAAFVVPLTVATATNDKYVVARGSHEEMTALKARVEASIAAAKAR